MQIKNLFVLSVIVSALTAHTASAAIISGTLNIGGSLAFLPNFTVDFVPPVGGPGGDFSVDPGFQSGDFIPLAGTSGSIHDLNNVDAPVLRPIALSNFLTFAGAPGLSFTLTLVEPGVFDFSQCLAAPAAGQNCTPPGLQYNFSNRSATNSVASFVLRGFVTDGSGDHASPFVGTFTTEFPDQSYQEVFETLSQGGRVNAPFRAHILVTAGVPEPGTISMILAGGVFLAGGAIHRRSVRG